VRPFEEIRLRDRFVDDLECSPKKDVKRFCFPNVTIDVWNKTKEIRRDKSDYGNRRGGMSLWATGNCRAVLTECSIGKNARKAAHLCRDLDPWLWGVTSEPIFVCTSAVVLSLWNPDRQLPQWPIGFRKDAVHFTVRTVKCWCLV
jgi:hypothetical protein